MSKHPVARRIRGWFLVLWLMAPIAAQACINDSETEVLEGEYRQQYYPDPQPLYQARIERDALVVGAGALLIVVAPTFFFTHRSKPRNSDIGKHPVPKKEPAIPPLESTQLVGVADLVTVRPPLWFNISPAILLMAAVGAAIGTRQARRGFEDACRLLS